MGHSRRVVGAARSRDFGSASQRVFFSALLISAMLLAGCARHEDAWTASTGSPAPGVQPVAYAAPAAGQLPPGDPREKQVRGCLSGANEDFVLVEERTGTVYRLQAPEEPTAQPNARQVFEALKLNDGRMVQLGGERRGSAGEGAPRFEVRDVSAIGEGCPANLMGATNQLNRPPASKVGLQQVSPPDVHRGSMVQPTPPANVRPVNPAH
jgi:hypothetical protein